MINFLFPKGENNLHQEALTCRYLVLFLFFWDVMLGNMCMFLYVITMYVLNMMNY